MRIALVVAVSQNGVIGAAGGLPWHLPSDLKHFKTVTMGKPMIMGRKTYETIGRPLPGRVSIVITRRPDWRADGVTTVATVEDALAEARQAAEKLGVSEICVIGGGEIYRQMLDMADRIYLTEVHMRVEGDTVFPELDRDVWSETSREHHAAGPRDSMDFSVVTLERTRAR